MIDEALVDDGHKITPINPVIGTRGGQAVLVVPDIAAALSPMIPIPFVA